MSLRLYPDLQVFYSAGNSLVDALDMVAQFDQPQVVVWYIGCRGLSTQCVDFYREAVFHPLLYLNSNASCWLTDLTAWNAFRERNRTLEQSSRLSTKLSSFSSTPIKYISASQVFSAIKQNTSEQFSELVNGILSRDKIWETSASYPNVYTTVGDLFGYDSAATINCRDKDVAKAYSAFQYLEGCILASMIANSVVGGPNNETTDILFLLPNNEIDYYQPISDFKEDLWGFLQLLCGQRASLIRNVAIIGFNYGSSTKERPYNLPGQRIRPHQISVPLIAGMGHPQFEHVANSKSYLGIQGRRYSLEVV